MGRTRQRSGGYGTIVAFFVVNFISAVVAVGRLERLGIGLPRRRWARVVSKWLLLSLLLLLLLLLFLLLHDGSETFRGSGCQRSKSSRR